MKENQKVKYIPLIISISIALIMLIASIVSITINIRNDKYFSDGKMREVVVYQYPVNNFNIDFTKAPKELYRELFTNSLDIEKVFNNEFGGFNKIVIKDGVIKVVDSNCKYHNCWYTTISKTNFIKNTEIVCMPNGLIVVLEVVE